VSETSNSAAAKTVLVVDDDELFCCVLTGLLEIQGYRAVVAMDGAEALRMVEQRGQEFDAVLVDLTMRPMNGRQILAQLKRLNPALPVVMMSGSEKEDIAEAAGQGAFPGFLQKPFSSEVLARAIRLASAAPAVP
jgi:two-component system cell cycle sensor histidine kinase/response regulator CckA